MHLPSFKFFSDGRAWALAPVLLLGVLVTVQGVLFSLSTNDPTFSVERDYYQKAITWDEQQRRQAQSDALGWQIQGAIDSSATDATLRLELRDAHGAPIRFAHVEVEAFANARASQVQRLNPTERTPGSYEASLHVAQGGLWEVRVSAQRNVDTYTQTLRLDAVPSSSGRGE